jgi:hypothetical protein
MGVTVELRKQYERTREIDNDDKFFIVWVLEDGKYKTRAGWIEKEFIEEDFVDAYEPMIGKESFSIIEVISFTDYDEYKGYKLNN